MTQSADFKNIKGLRGREPLGAVISIGRKANINDNQRTGLPIEKDRWHILSVRGTPVQDGGRTHDIRIHNPRFRLFNELPVERRTVLALELVHAKFDDCFSMKLVKQQGPNRDLNPPSKRPFCQGDGVNAERFTGRIDRSGPKEVEQFRMMKCPNDMCEFRQGDSPTCKPFATLLGRLVWPEVVQDRLPSVLVKYTTRAWNTASYLKGLFDSVEREAANMGVTEFSWAFLPIQLQVTEHTRPGRRFPVVHATLLTTPYDFLAAQAERATQIEEFKPLALTDKSMTSPGEVARDLHSTDSGRQGIAPAFAGERVGEDPVEVEAEVVASTPAPAPKKKPSPQSWRDALDNDGGGR